VCKKKEGACAYKQCVHEMIIYTRREDMNKTLIRKEYDIMKVNQHCTSIMMTFTT